MIARIIDSGRRTAAWAKASRPGRAWAHFSRSGGSLMAGGLAYTALFSLFSVLTIAVSIFTVFLGNNSELRTEVMDTINGWLPGVIDDGSGTGLVSVNDLTFSAGFGIASIVAFVVLLYSALRFMSGLRQALRTMFCTEATQENPLLAKLRDLAGFVFVFVALLVTSMSALAVSGLFGWLSDLLGFGLGTFGVWLVRIVTMAISLVVDTIVVAALFWLLGRARPARRDLIIGAGAAALALEVMRLLGTGVIAAGKSNALLASFTVIVTVLVWTNLLAQVLLVTAAWTANPPAPPDEDDEQESPGVSLGAEREASAVKPAGT